MSVMVPTLIFSVKLAVLRDRCDYQSGFSVNKDVKAFLENFCLSVVENIN